MDSPPFQRIYEQLDLKDRLRVFRNRSHAGEILAEMLGLKRFENSIIFSIPAGGVPVGVKIAEKLSLPFDLAVVSKITLPWNTEAGYGAVAFDGTKRLNQEMLSCLGLNEKEINEGITQTTQKVNRRIEKLRGRRPFPNLSGQPVILVDDGIASGFTLLVAVEALKKAGTDQITIAVPTGHRESINLIVNSVSAVYCPNIRSGWRFAVADAYAHWSDVDDATVVRLLKQLMPL